MADSPHQRLQYARRNAGFRNPTEAARQYGWTQSTYLAHENGTRGLKPKIINVYARAFSVDPAWIMYGAGEMAQNSNAKVPAGLNDTHAILQADNETAPVLALGKALENGWFENLNWSTRMALPAAHIQNADKVVIVNEDLYGLSYEGLKPGFPAIASSARYPVRGDITVIKTSENYYTIGLFKHQSTDRITLDRMNLGNIQLPKVDVQEILVITEIRRSL